MTRDDKVDLLYDLTRLLRKYGPDTFISLANDLDNPEFVATLTKVLRKTTDISRSTSRRMDRRNSPYERAEAIAKRTESDDAAKSKTLQDFLENFRSRRILNSTSETIRFLEDRNIVTSGVRTRGDAIVRIMENLSALDLKNILELISSLDQQDSSDRSLKGWADLIMNRR